MALQSLLWHMMSEMSIPVFFLSLVLECGLSGAPGINPMFHLTCWICVNSKLSSASCSGISGQTIFLLPSVSCPGVQEAGMDVVDFKFDNKSVARLPAKSGRWRNDIIGGSVRCFSLYYIKIHLHITFYPAFLVSAIYLIHLLHVSSSDI